MASDSLYGKKLTGKWREAFAESQQFDYETIIRESFYVAHGRILSQIEGAGKFSKEAKTLLQACEVLVEQGELTQEFVEELKLRLLGLDLHGMLQAFQGTLALADGAIRFSKLAGFRRQIEICKSFIVAVLKNSQDRVARELAIACIQQLKLDAELPLEDLEALIDEAKQKDGEQKDGEQEETQKNSQTQAREKVQYKKDVLEVPDDVLEGDLWDE